MEKIIAWKLFFQRWPASIPKQGIVLTSLNEGIAFSGFQVSEQLLLLERDRPDTSGARNAIVFFGDVEAVKLTAPIDPVQFKDMGFRSVN